MEPLIRFAESGDLINHIAFFTLFFTFTVTIILNFYFNKKVKGKRIKVFFITLAAVFTLVSLQSLIVWKKGDLMIKSRSFPIHLMEEEFIGSKHLMGSIDVYLKGIPSGWMPPKDFEEKIGQLRENPEVEYRIITSSKNSSGDEKTKEEKYTLDEKFIRKHNALENYYNWLKMYENAYQELKEGK